MTLIWHDETFLFNTLPFSSAPNDYTGGSFNVFIPAGSTNVTLTVDTLTDNILEDAEHFKAILTIPGSPGSVVVGSPNMAFVAITNTTSMWRLSVSVIQHTPLGFRYKMLCKPGLAASPHLSSRGRKVISVDESGNQHIQSHNE